MHVTAVALYKTGLTSSYNCNDGADCFTAVFKLSSPLPLLIFLLAVWLSLSDISCHAKQVFLSKLTDPVCVPPCSLLLTQKGSVIKDLIHFLKGNGWVP